MSSTLIRLASAVALLASLASVSPGQTRDKAPSKPVDERASQIREAFDAFLFNLVGAFDASARAANLCLPAPEKKEQVGWQKQPFRKLIRPHAPKLAALFDKSTAGADLFELTRMLRNTVHGEAMHGLVHEYGGRREVLVTIPEDDATAVRALCERLGGADSWGLDSLVGVGECVRAGTFIERLLPRALALLDDALRLTPVERLTGQTNAVGPPAGVSMFALGARTRACLLYGLPVPVW